MAKELARFGRVLFLSCLFLFMSVRVSYESETMLRAEELSELPELPDSELIGPINETGIIPEWFGCFPPEVEEDYAAYQINAFVAVDEEFQAISYPTPPWGDISWRAAARNIIERGDDPFYNLAHCHVKILTFLTWDSDDTVHDAEQFLLEAARETGYYYGKLWGTGGIYTVHLLIAFTTQNIGFAVAGRALKGLHAVVIKPQVYWADDNLFQHELTHIFGPKDHWPGEEGFDEDCVMSYRTQYVRFWHEEGWIWFVNYDVKVAYLTENWCQTCEDMIRANLEPYEVTHHCFGNWAAMPRSEVKT